MSLSFRTAAVAALSFVAFPGVGFADITPIGPFTGQYSEPLNFSNTNISASQPIFGGRARLDSHNGQTLIHLLLGSTLSGDPVTPRTGQYILGWTEGPGVFVFTTPIVKFGSYWNNNSGVSNATVKFYDSGNVLVGMQTAITPAPGNVWVWNGWESTTPVSRMVVEGSGVLNGFLWFDDLEITQVPGPGGAVVLALGVLMRRWRR